MFSAFGYGLEAVTLTNIVGYPLAPGREALVITEDNVIGFVPSNYVRKESFVEKAKGTIKGFGKPNKSKSKLLDYQQSYNNSFSEPSSARPALAAVSGNGTFENGFDRKPKSNFLMTAVAKYSYEPQREDELRLTKGDVVDVLEKSSDGWWKGVCRNETGWFPSNYVDESPPATFSSPNSSFDNPIIGKTVNYWIFYLTFPSRFMSLIWKCFGSHGKCSINVPPMTPKVMEIVVTLYAFDAQSAEELSFRKGERLEIIEHPAHDPEWWKARNSKGCVGLIPTNYIEVIQVESKEEETKVSEEPKAEETKDAVIFSSSEVLGAAASEPYYYGKISRSEADSQLNERGEEGDFLLRDSESNIGEFSISLKAKERNKHFLIKVDQAGKTFKIGSRTFQTMDALVKHYTSSPIYTNEPTNERLFLVKALPR
uniref:NCK2 n=1 Tax=Syphacia muris TaxID=451379 RepID=A0A0N5AW97_9BILA